MPIDLDRNYEDFRYPVQYVLRPNLDFRGFSGKVASGIVRKGDTVMALPSGKTSKVKSIVTYEGELEQAFPSSMYYDHLGGRDRYLPWGDAGAPG